MATYNKNLSGGILSDIETPSVGTVTGGGGRAAVTMSPVAQAANIVADLLPTGVKLWQQAQTSALQEELSGKLLKIADARQTGQYSPAQAETLYRQTVLEYKKANPTYTDEINAISMAAIGRTPVIEAEQTHRDLIKRAEEYAAITHPGLSGEDAIQAGMNGLQQIKAMETALQRQQIAGETSKVMSKQFLSTLEGQANTAISSRINPLMDQLSEAALSVDSASGAQATSLALNSMEQTLKGIKREWLSSVSTLASSEQFAKYGLNIGDTAKEAEAIIDRKINAIQESIVAARDNGFLKQLNDMVKMFENEAKIDATKAMPFTSKLMSMYGSDVVKAYMTPEIVKGLGEIVMNEVQNLTLSGMSLEGDSKAVRTNKLNALLSTLKGDITVEDLNNPEDRASVLKALGKTVQQYTEKYEPNKYPGQEDAFLNSSSNLMGVAASIDIRTLANVERVTGLVNNNFVKILKESKDQGRADMVADTTVNVLFKENVILSNELKSAGSLGNVVEFDKNSGAVKLRQITIDDLTDQQKNRLSFIKKNVGAEPTQKELWAAAGVTYDSYQQRVDKWNSNIRKQFMFADYSNSMTKAKDSKTWAEVMSVKSGLPYVKGQQPSDNLSSILDVTGKADLDQRMEQVVPGLASVENSLANVRRDLQTGMFFDRDRKVAALEKRRKTAERINKEGESPAVPRIRIGF